MTTWNEYNIHVNREASESVSNIVIEAGSQGVSVSDRNDFLHLPEYGFDTLWALNEKDFPNEGVIVKGYFSTQKDKDELKASLKTEIEKLKEHGIDPGPYQITVHSVDEENWATAWKKYYHPVRITRYLTVVPDWETYEAKNEDEKLIQLDPGLAFGTGTHPTTRLCIQALETIIQGGETLVDVGTGSGVLTIASALLGAETIHAFDLDEVAVKSAKDNINLNKLDADIHVKANDLLKEIDLKADMVVANILAEIITPLIPDAWRVLKKGGWFISSGIIEEKKGLILHQLKEQGFDIFQVLQMKDWIAIIAQKPEDESKIMKEG